MALDIENEIHKRRDQINDIKKKNVPWRVMKPLNSKVFDMKVDYDDIQIGEGKDEEGFYRISSERLTKNDDMEFTFQKIYSLDKIVSCKGKLLMIDNPNDLSQKYGKDYKLQNIIDLGAKGTCGDTNEPFEIVMRNQKFLEVNTEPFNGYKVWFNVDKDIIFGIGTSAGNEHFTDKALSGKKGGVCTCPDGVTYKVGESIATPDSLSCVDGTGTVTETADTETEFSYKKAICKKKAENIGTNVFFFKGYADMTSNQIFTSIYFPADGSTGPYKNFIGKAQSNQNQFSYSYDWPDKIEDLKWHQFDGKPKKVSWLGWVQKTGIIINQFKFFDKNL